MESVTDKYGNLKFDLKGKKVNDGNFEFYVEKVTKSGLAVLDKTKPFKILNKNHPMVHCVKSGGYAVDIVRLKVEKEGK
jgi:hypothetical protein